MTNVIFTYEQYAAARERFLKRHAECQEAKANFALVCAKIATEPRSSFGPNFKMSFEEIVDKEVVRDRERINARIDAAVR